MKNEFVPYEQALALKELGFDEPCFGFYADKTGENTTIYTVSDFQSSINSMSVHYNNNCSSYQFSAPLYQQAFRWFREKYGYHKEIIWDHSEPIIWYYAISKIGNLEFDHISSYPNEVFNKSEEAEHACLDKLIEIVKK